VRILLAAALCALAVVAGCGSSDDVSLADAQRDFVIACRQGATDPLDAKLCRCIAAEAVKRPEYDTPQELATLNDAQSSTKLPAALDKIVTRCAERFV
jgi:hypothetical protein